MRILIAEDDPTSRRLLLSLLAHHGECRSTDNGEEAVEAFRLALDQGAPFDLVCLDIMMPVKDGRQAACEMREIERRQGVKPAAEATIIMVTALDDPLNVVDAYYQGGAALYLTKPIDVRGFPEALRNLGLIA